MSQRPPTRICHEGGCKLLHAEKEPYFLENVQIFKKKDSQLREKRKRSRLYREKRWRHVRWKRMKNIRYIIEGKRHATQRVHGWKPVLGRICGFFEEK